jgi:chromosome segregation ATPase
VGAFVNSHFAGYAPDTMRPTRGADATTSASAKTAQDAPILAEAGRLLSEGVALIAARLFDVRAAQLDDRIAKLEKLFITDVDTKLNSLGTTRDALHKQVDELATKVATLRDDLVVANRALGKSRQEIEACLHSQQTALASAEAARASCAKEHRDEVARLAESLSKLKTDLEHVRHWALAQVEQTKNELATGLAASLNARIADLESAHGRLTQQVAEAGRHAAVAQELETGVQSALAQTDEQLAALAHKVDDLSIAVAAMTSKPRPGLKGRLVRFGRGLWSRITGQRASSQTR